MNTLIVTTTSALTAKATAMTAAVQTVNTAAPVFLCADPDEAERLALRDLHAIWPTPRGTP